MILVVDNFDSFTYNLTDMFLRRGLETLVFRNNELLPAQALALKPAAVVFSPGPGKPAQAGNSPQLMQTFWGRVPLLGVCLGLQLMVEQAGGRVVKAIRPMHGKISRINHGFQSVFANLPQDISVMRYHSLVAERESLPECFTVTAVTYENEIMALAHKTLPIVGVQFHPESILTPQGDLMIQNWLESCGI